MVPVLNIQVNQVCLAAFIKCKIIFSDNPDLWDQSAVVQLHPVDPVHPIDRIFIVFFSGREAILFRP